MCLIETGNLMQSVNTRRDILDMQLVVEKNYGI